MTTNSVLLPPQQLPIIDKDTNRMNNTWYNWFRHFSSTTSELPGVDGFVVVSGTSTLARSISAGSGIGVTNGSGVAANPSIAIDNSIVATLTDSQTLTNKTLTSPTINGATINTSTLVTPVITLEQSTNPTNVSEGRIQWDTNDDVLVVGNSSEALSVNLGVWKTFTPGFTGFSADPTVNAKYTLIGKTCIVNIHTTVTGTSNATGFTITSLPFTSRNSTASFWGKGIGNDNSAVVGVTAEIAANSSIMVLYNGNSLTAASWTNANNKYTNITMIYEIT